MRHFKHRKKSFDELPLHARRTLAVKMAGDIRRDPNGRGVFTTYDILPGSEEWAEDMGGRGFWCGSWRRRRRTCRKQKCENGKDQLDPGDLLHFPLLYQT